MTYSHLRAIMILVLGTCISGCAGRKETTLDEQLARDAFQNLSQRTGVETETGAISELLIEPETSRNYGSPGWIEVTGKQRLS